MTDEKKKKKIRERIRVEIKENLDQVETSGWCEQFCCKNLNNLKSLSQIKIGQKLKLSSNFANQSTIATQFSELELNCETALSMGNIIGNIKKKIILK